MSLIYAASFSTHCTMRKYVTFPKGTLDKNPLYGRHLSTDAYSSTNIFVPAVVKKGTDFFFANFFLLARCFSCVILGENVTCFMQFDFLDLSIKHRKSCE